MSSKPSFSLVDWFRMLTWESIQSILGLLSIIGIGGFFSIYKFRRYFTGLISETGITRGAFSLGPIIFGPQGLKPDYRDHLFIHETGHSYQSRYIGPFYIFIVGIPSVLSAWLIPKLHNQRWYEVWANNLAIKHAMKHFPSFDLKAYVTSGHCSKYQNPRNGGNNYGGNPIIYEFKWFDLLLLLPGLSILLWLVWLVGQWIFA